MARIIPQPKGSNGNLLKRIGDEAVGDGQRRRRRFGEGVLETLAHL